MNIIMEEYIKIEQYLANGNDGNIVKQNKNPMRGLVVMLLGIAVLIVALRSHLPETAQIAFMTLGVLAALAGGIMMVLVCTSECGGYRFKTTGAKMCHYRRYITANDKQKFVACVNSGDMRPLEQVHKETSTGTLMHAYVATDGSYAILQVEEYIPHDFVPITAPVALDQPNATLLLQWIKS